MSLLEFPALSGVETYMRNQLLALFGLTLVVSVAAARFPDPARDQATASGPQTAVLAGGCFWGVEAVFESLNGVSDVVSGYAGGQGRTAHYEQVGTGSTGHAESVKITYDPARITYGQLLKVFFAVAHDPTEVNRQGPDEGPQYRSEIFYASDDQKAVAEAYVSQLNAAKVFRRPIATRIDPLTGFFPAEGYHQDFLVRNTTNPYIVANDLPKLRALKATFPELVKTGK
ncbi:MAG TPA: peptide-methionine (S)-S-oxide reductase MsrA [Tepidisphaeraceae bacterium]|nr:peptide-methionine (S)-S-oxide reductase MsrA [Tepidisphaeraceae bacterium]